MDAPRRQTFYGVTSFKKTDITTEYPNMEFQVEDWFMVEGYLFERYLMTAINPFNPHTQLTQTPT